MLTKNIWMRITSIYKNYKKKNNYKNYKKKQLQKLQKNNYKNHAKFFTKSIPSKPNRFLYTCRQNPTLL